MVNYPCGWFDPGKLNKMNTLDQAIQRYYETKG